MKLKRLVTSTYSRNVSFGDFTINGGETKELPEGIEVPEEWKSHLHVRTVEEPSEESDKTTGQKAKLR